MGSIPAADGMRGEQPAAEAVDRRDPGGAELVDGPLEAHPRVGVGCGDPAAGELGTDPLAELGAGAVGEGKGDHLLWPDSLVLDQVAVAVDEDPRLAGAGSRLEQDSRCPGPDRGALLGSRFADQRHSSGCSSSSRRSGTTPRSRRQIGAKPQCRGHSPSSGFRSICPARIRPTASVAVVRASSRQASNSARSSRSVPTRLESGQHRVGLGAGQAAGPGILGSAQRLVEASRGVDSPEVTEGEQVERQLQLGVGRELRARRPLDRDLVVVDEPDAPGFVDVDPVDPSLQRPAAEVEAGLAVLPLAERRLQQLRRQQDRIA